MQKIYGQPWLFDAIPHDASDPDKLRMLADWFDEYDRRNETVGQDEVQRDLRRIADTLERRE